MIRQTWIVDLDVGRLAVVTSDDNVEKAAEDVRGLLDVLLGAIRRQQVIDATSRCVVRSFKMDVECCIANFLQSLAVKEFLKSVKI